MIKILVLLAIVSSCSSQLGGLFFKSDDHSDKNEELLEDFEVQEDVLNRFKAIETSEEPTASDELKSGEKEKKQEIKDSPKVVKRNSIKPKKNKLTTQLQKRPEKEDKKKKTKISKKVVKKVKTDKPQVLKDKAKEPLPDDFPEKLVAIDEMTSKYWSVSQPYFKAGEMMKMKIRYMGVSTGEVYFKSNRIVQLDGQEAYHLTGQAKTSDYYSYLYVLNDNVESYLKKEDLVPLKFSLIQRQSGQNIDDLQLFDHKSRKVFTFYKRVTDEKTKKKKGERYIPSRFQDPLSIVFYIRGLPMDKVETYKIPFINQGDLMFLNVKVKEKATIETEIGEMQAVKVVASSKYSGDTLKSGDMTFFFSNDERRIFLKFEVKIKIGTIVGDIFEYVDP